VSFVLRAARPALVKQKFRRIIGRDVQVIKQTAILLSRWREDLGQCIPQFRLFSGAGLKADGHDNWFCVHWFCVHGYPSSPAQVFHQAEFDDPFGSCFGYLNRPVAANRDIVNGVEHGIAGSPEADGSDDIPVAVEFENACVLGIVVGAANSDVKETIGIGVDTNHPSASAQHRPANGRAPNPRSAIIKLDSKPPRHVNINPIPTRHRQSTHG
jgi:hypothetical protein